jgi:CheY-like chemotaxis protein
LEGTETILFVEDNEMLRPLATEVLEGYGYTVRAAPDGTEAIAIAKEHHADIDLLLTDMVMPGLSGRELANVLSESYPHLKVLFTSGYPGSSFAKVRQDRRVAFIQKPYLAGELARKIRETLDS